MTRRKVAELLLADLGSSRADIPKRLGACLIWHVADPGCVAPQLLYPEAYKNGNNLEMVDLPPSRWRQNNITALAWRRVFVAALVAITLVRCGSLAWRYRRAAWARSPFLLFLQLPCRGRSLASGMP